MPEEVNTLEVAEHTHDEFVDKVRGVKTTPETPAPPKTPLETPPAAPQATPPATPDGKPNPVTELTEATTDWKSEYERLKGEVDAKKNVNPYSNPNYYKLEKLESENAEEAKLYQKLVFGDPDPKELWKIGFKKDHPDATPEQIQRRLEKAFPALFDSNLAAEDPERKDAEMDLDLEAKKVKRDLMKRFDGIEVPDQKKLDDAQRAKADELVRNWKPRFEQLAADTKFKVSLPTGENNAVEEYDFEIPAAEMGKYLERAAYHTLSSGYKADQEGYAKVKNFMVREYVADNYGTLFSSNAKIVSEKRDALWSKKVNNPAPVTAPPVSETAGGKLSDQEVLAENLARADRAIKQ